MNMHDAIFVFANQISEKLADGRDNPPQVFIKFGSRFAQLLVKEPCANMCAGFVDLANGDLWSKKYYCSLGRKRGNISTEENRQKALEAVDNMGRIV